MAPKEQELEVNVSRNVPVLVAYMQEAAAIVTVNLCMTNMSINGTKCAMEYGSPFDSNTDFSLLTGHIIGCRRPC